MDKTRPPSLKVLGGRAISNDQAHAKQKRLEFANRISISTTADTLIRIVVNVFADEPDRAIDQQELSTTHMLGSEAP